MAKRLIEVNLKEHKCERCKRTEWEGNPIPIELHHINGVHSDNRLENLQIVTASEHRKIHNNTKKIIRDEKGQIIGVKKSDKIGEGCDANPELTN